MPRSATRRSFVQMLVAAPLLAAATGGSAFAEAAPTTITA